jgi:hypothetical protein
LALAERITGVRIERDWLEKKHRVVVVTPLLEEIYPGVTAEHTYLAEFNPDVATPIRGASPAALRRIVLTAAERAATETGLDSDPAINAALEALRRNAQDFTTHRAQLVPVLQELERAGRLVIAKTRSNQKTTEQEGKVFPRIRAGYAVRNALLQDSMIAALQAVYDASQAVSAKDRLFRDVISMATQSPEQRRRPATTRLARRSPDRSRTRCI